MATQTEGQREAWRWGLTSGPRAVAFAKHWDAGGLEAVQKNWDAIKAADQAGDEIVSAPSSIDPQNVYARRQAEARAARGEPPVEQRQAVSAFADPEALYARRAMARAKGCAA